MSENKKQREERLGFECLQRNLAGLEDGIPMREPAPDIATTFEGQEISIEVTSIDRNDKENAFLSFQQCVLETTQKKLRKIVKIPSNVCLEVKIHWNNFDTYFGSKDHRGCSRYLIKTILENIKHPLKDDYHDEIFLMINENRKNPFHAAIISISLCCYQISPEQNMGGQIDVLVVNGGNSKPAAEIEAIKCAINDKKRKFAIYQNYFSGPIWLLLTTNFSAFRMPWEISQKSLHIESRHPFQRVFLVDHSTNRMIEIFHIYRN